LVLLSAPLKARPMPVRAVEAMTACLMVVNSLGVVDDMAGSRQSRHRTDFSGSIHTYE
jgi:hypothetical protein